MSGEGNCSENTDESGKLFCRVKYKCTGRVSENVLNILKESGAEGSQYYSDHTTHCIVGDDPSETDICDAKDLYEIPAVKAEWVAMSYKCCKLLPSRPFTASEDLLFHGLHFCCSQISREDCSLLWGLITFNGGNFSLNLSSRTTHLICGRASGTKYEQVMKSDDFKIIIITPDWVMECLNHKSRVPDHLFHPRLLVTTNETKKVMDLSSCFSTAHITGFADDEVEAKDPLDAPKISNELLERLKQRMPWNQPQVSTATSTVVSAPSPSVTTVKPTLTIPVSEIKEELRPQQLTPNFIVQTTQVSPGLQQLSRASQIHTFVQPSQVQRANIVVHQQQVQQIQQQQAQQQQLPQQQLQLQQTLQQPQLQQQQIQQQQLQQQQLQQLQQQPQQQLQQLQQQQLQQQQLQQQQLQQQQIQHQRIQVPVQRVPQWRAQQQLQQTHLVHQQLTNSSQQQTLTQTTNIATGAITLQQNISQPGSIIVQGISQPAVLSQQTSLSQPTIITQQTSLGQVGQTVQLQQQFTQQPTGHAPMVMTQTQHEGQQFIVSQAGPTLQHQRPQQIVHQQKPVLQQQQFIVREATGVAQTFTESKPQTQFTWQQQQFAQRQQLIPTPQQGQTPQQLPQRQITWMQQQGGQGAPRQLIQMDAQTHAQLQQMDPQQKAMFLQRLQKQRQMMLQKQLQANQQQQQTRVIEQGQVQYGVVRPTQIQGQTAVIRGQMIQGQAPQHQLQWIQQQRQNQIILQQNRQQLLVQQQQQQLTTPNIVRTPAPQTIQHQRLPVSVVAQATNAPHTVVQTWQGDGNIAAVQSGTITPNQQQQQMMRQQQIQRIQQIRQQHQQQQQQQQQQLSGAQRMTHYSTQINLAQAAVQPGTALHQPDRVETPNPDLLAGATSPQTQQQGLVVNAKTKTALANMLSVRLQGGGVVPGGDGTAAGQLRMMTAQHQAQLPPPPPQPTVSYQQRPTISPVNAAPVGITRPNEGVIGTSVPKPTPAPAACPPTPGRVSATLKSPSSVPATPALPRQQFFGHNPNLKLPPDMFLLGCIFLIMEYDRSGYDVTVWRRVILENGGETELSYCTRVTHILCQTQKHPLVQQGLRDGKRCITAEWLNDVILKQQVVPPWLALHYPTLFSDEKPCRNFIISYSGFEGEERVRIKKMIEAVGAKCTSYYTSHNNILICKKPEGDKYKKAREWGKSVVNVQWLNEILFGHYSCLQHPENQKYQQFNIANPFRIDYTLVPHLMAAWKVPIPVTNECFERAKASGIISPKVKRRRISSPTPSMPKTNQENLMFEHTLPPIGNTTRPIILFSGLTSTTNDDEKKVIHLGGVLARSSREATHLIMYKVQRTVKLLCCLSTCQYIVTTKWLEDSYNAAQFLDEQRYIIDDLEFENKHNCNMLKLLSNPTRSKLFQDKIFYITPGVIPSQASLTEMVLCAGGTVEKQRRSLKRIQEMDQYTYIVITTRNDMHLVLDLIRSNFGVYSTEFIMTAILTQKIPYETVYKRSIQKKA